MASVLFDTCILITYKPTNPPVGTVMSAVVIQELAAGALDKSEVQRFDATRKAYEKAGRLLVPTSEDWWLAGKVLNSLFRGLKSRAKGKTRRIAKAEQQRIVRDVLIARSARRVNAILVTDNIADFGKVDRFCKVNLCSGSDYFKLRRYLEIGSRY